MAIIDEIIRVETDGTLSFGDYLSVEKRKTEDFEVEGDLYKVKTCEEITRLEKNGKLLLETVPGAAIHNLTVTERTVHFKIEGSEDTRVTVELEPGGLYRVRIEETNIGNVKSNVSGKVVFSLDLDETPKSVEIRKA